jgi:hypothetical protein
MSVNYKTPAHQRAALAAAANPTSNKIAAQQKVTYQTAAKQGKFKAGLARLGLERSIHEDNMDLAYDRLDWQQSQFDTGMKNAKESSKLEVYGGLGNALIAGLFGRQKRQDNEKKLKQRQGIIDRLDNLYGA